MPVVTSTDGTRIAFERLGQGATVILVGGGLDDGSENQSVAAELATQFTTINYARRGRGESGDAQPYAVEREVEDIAALIEAVGGRAHLFGASSGGMFALEAAMAGLPIERIAVYEVPYDVSDGAEARFSGYRAELAKALREGRRGDAVELFMRLAGSSADEIAGARSSRWWPGLEGLAHTLAYDAALYGPPPTSRLAAISQPTMVASSGANPFFDSAADAVAAALPSAERLTLAGQDHVADPRMLAAALGRFLAGQDARG
jgi:pimeloyl-ACP methyl ester carboxylesterase